jgi:hypothetical protein
MKNKFTSFNLYSSSLIFLFLKKEPLMKVSLLASDECNERNASCLPCTELVEVRTMGLAGISLSFQ